MELRIEEVIKATLRYLNSECPETDVDIIVSDLISNINLSDLYKIDKSNSNSKVSTKESIQDIIEGRIKGSDKFILIKVHENELLKDKDESIKIQLVSDLDSSDIKEVIKSIIKSKSLNT